MVYYSKERNPLTVKGLLRYRTHMGRCYWSDQDVDSLALRSTPQPFEIDATLSFLDSARYNILVHHGCTGLLPSVSPSPTRLGQDPAEDLHQCLVVLRHRVGH